MQKYQDNVINSRGRAIEGALVTVKTLAGAAATIYSDNGVTVIAAPLLTDAEGYFAFYAADGRYTITVTGTGIVTEARTDILLEDPADGSAALAASSGSSLVGHIASGVGTVARTLQAKARDIVCTKDFGAVCDGSNDDIEEIQAAVTANPGGFIYQVGNSKVTGTLTVSTARTTLWGASQATLTQATANIDTVLFQPTTAGVTADYLNSSGIHHINVNHSAAVAAVATSGAAIRFRQCNGYRLSNVTVNDAFEGITVEGGQFGSLKSFALFASQGSYAGAETALLHFRQAAYSSGPTLYQSAFTTEIEDFRLSATLLRGTCIRIANGDGLQFSQGYVANGADSLLRVKADRDNSYVTGTGFTNTYFDCVGAGKTQNGIHLPDDGFANTFIYGLKIGSGCIIGNGDQVGVLGRKANTMDLSIEGATILNMLKWAVDVEGSTSYTDLHVSGSQIQNCGDGTSGGIRASTGRSLSIVGNTFSSTESVCLLASGTWGQGTVTGNTNSSDVADFSNLATYTYALAISGNSSRSTAAATSWMGLRTGNVAVTDPKVLDWYEEAAFTPGVTFGGAAVGLTYTLQSGKFTRIGDRVLYTGTVTLLTKGSSVGAALITGLPYVNGASNGQPGSLHISAITAGVGDQFLSMRVVGAATTIRLDKIASGATAATQLTDADFSDTTTISFSGQYYV